MGAFDIFREYGGPTLYGPIKSPVSADVLEAGLICAAVILLLSFFIVLPGFRGKERLFLIVKCFFGVFVTTLIMLCNFGQEWEVSHITSYTPYRAGLSQEINADIGVKIGLRSVNITLRTDPEVQVFPVENETINYNERFHWDNMGWTQGRGGFGPFAGRFNQEFREAQVKGLPYPILWIAEYFTLDGEGIRWGRHYRQAGYYTHILVWLAFPLWILSMILLKLVLLYGAYFSMLTGVILILANVLYATIRNDLDLVIPFKDNTLNFEYGWCFWMNLFNGLLCILLGFIVWIMDIFYREAIYTFLGVDILEDYEEYYDVGDVVIPTMKPNKRPELNEMLDNNQNGDIPLPEVDRGEGVIEEDHSGVYDNKDLKPHYRRRQHGTFVSRYGRTRKTRMRPESSDSDETPTTMRFRPGSINEGLEVDMDV